MDSRLILIRLIGILHGAQFALYKIAVHKQSLILSVIIVKLWIRISAVKANASSTSLIDCMCCMTVYHRFQSHLTEPNDCCTDHSLEAEIISDID